MPCLRCVMLTVFVVIGLTSSSRSEDKPAIPSLTNDGAPQIDLELKPLSEISTRIATPPDETGQPHLPPNHAEPRFALVDARKHCLGQSRGWSPNEICWTAPGLVHRPLYFEDVVLERYGYSHGCVQPVVSAGRFASQIALLPYQWTLDHPCCPQYTLGYDRPGNCVPYRCHFLPWSSEAALIEAGTLTGLAFLIPW